MSLPKRASKIILEWKFISNILSMILKPVLRAGALRRSRSYRSSLNLMFEVNLYLYKWKNRQFCSKYWCDHPRSIDSMFAQTIFGSRNTMSLTFTQTVQSHADAWLDAWEFRIRFQAGVMLALFQLGHLIKTAFHCMCRLTTISTHVALVKRLHLYWRNDSAA